MNNVIENHNFYTDDVSFCPPNAMKATSSSFNFENDDKVLLSVFDMDGTAINTSSPVKLVKKLSYERRISRLNAFRIALWALAYKLQLPRKNNPVRQRVFRAFKGKDALEVNDYLKDFAKSEIVPFIRSSCACEMKKNHEQNIINLLLSASFDGVVCEVMRHLPVDFAIATRMKIDERGCYDNVVEGIAPEGQGKATTLKEFADANFGVGRWEVVSAFGDHLSDVPVLELAKRPVAVTPDKALKRYATKNNWDIEMW